MLRAVTFGLSSYSRHVDWMAGGLVNHRPAELSAVTILYLGAEVLRLLQALDRPHIDAETRRSERPDLQGIIVEQRSELGLGAIVAVECFACCIVLTRVAEPDVEDLLAGGERIRRGQFRF